MTIFVSNIWRLLIIDDHDSLLFSLCELKYINQKWNLLYNNHTISAQFINAHK